MKNRLVYIFIFLSIITNIFASHTLQKVSLQLKWKNAFQFAGYYMAKEKGFYKDAGLDVDILEYHKSDTLSDAVSGKINYGIADSSLILKKSNGAPIVVLGTIFQHSPLALMTLKSSNITKLNQLKNKTIMASAAFFENPYIKAMFYANKIYPKDVKIIPLSFNIEDLIKKKTDAYAVYVTDQPYTMKQKGIEYNLISSMDYGIDFYSDMLFTSKNEIDKHPERTKAFVRASLRGWEYAYSHLDETIKTILMKYNTQNLTYEKLAFEARSMRDLLEIDSENFGEIDKNKIDNVINMYSVVGDKINRDVFKDFIYKMPDEDIELSSKEVAFLSHKKSIKMCVDPNWMPLEMIKDGKHVGVSAEYFKLLQKNISVPIELVKTKTWLQSLEYAKKRKCDILSLAMSTDNRKKYMNFTKPYLSTPLVIVTKLDKIFITDINSIKSQKLGITKGYAFAEVLRKKYPNINLVEVNSIQQGLQMVYEGKLYGFIDTLFSAGYELQKSYFGALKIAGKFDKKWELGIAVRNDEPELLSIFNKAIDKISEGQKQGILNQWISIKYEKGFDYKILGYIGIFFLFVLIFYFYKEKTLKKYNDILESKNRELEIIASTDMLTGTRSRRSFFDIAGQYILAAKREKNHLSFLMLDIDHFKKINDTYGHSVGDEVLKHFANIVSENLRKSDIFGRIGGEEFGVILNDTDKGIAQMVAQKIRIGVKNSYFEIENKKINITLSVGISTLDKDDTLDVLFEKADEALYESKQNGRDQVTLYKDAK